MNKKQNTKLFLLAGFVALTACSGSSDDSPAPPIGDISGQWQVNEINQSTTPQCVSSPSYFMDVTQIDNAVSADTQDGEFDGTISGNIVNWTGSYPERGGITTVTSMTLTVAASCNTFTSEAAWTWTDGFSSCSGTSTATGDRVIDSGC